MTPRDGPAGRNARAGRAAARARQTCEPQDAHQVQAQDDEHDAADRLEQRQVVVAAAPTQPRAVRPRTVNTIAEAQHEGDGVGHGRHPTVRPRPTTTARAGAARRQTPRGGDRPPHRAGHLRPRPLRATATECPAGRGTRARPATRTVTGSEMSPANRATPSVRSTSLRLRCGPGAHVQERRAPGAALVTSGSSASPMATTGTRAPYRCSRSGSVDTS